MKLFFSCLLFFCIAVAAVGQAIDFGWNLHLIPDRGAERKGGSVAASTDGSTFAAGELHVTDQAVKIEVFKVDASGLQVGDPLVLQHDGFDCVRPQIFMTEPDGPAYTVFYERVDRETGSKMLSWVQVDAGGTLVRDEVVATVSSVDRAKKQGLRLYVLVTEPLATANFKVVKLYQFMGGASSVVLTVNRQDDRKGVSFTFDDFLNVYVLSNVTDTSLAPTPWGSLDKYAPGSSPYAFVWSQSLRIDTRTLEGGDVAYGAGQNFVAVGGTYNQSATQGNPMVYTVMLDGSAPAWLWWGLPGGASNVKFTRMQIWQNRWRLGGYIPQSFGYSHRHYMDIESYRTGSGFANWWYSSGALPGGAVNDVETSLWGEPIFGSTHSEGNFNAWLAASPQPGGPFSGIWFSPYTFGNGACMDVQLASDQDWVSVGTLSTGMVVTQILMKPMPFADTFEGFVSAVPKASEASVLQNDLRKNGAIAELVVGPHGAGKTDQGNDITLQADGTFTYSPRAGFSGTDTFSYTAYKIGSAQIKLQSTPTLVTLQVAENGAPLAVDDTFNVFNDKPVVIDPLGNDSDPEDQPLTIVSRCVPEHGRVGIVDNQLRYIADEGYLGPDSFQYTIEDPAGNQATAWIFLNVSAKPVILKSVKPNRIDAGGLDVTLVLAGSNFKPNSRVTASGTELASTYISATKLEATLPASMTAVEALYEVRVHNTSGAVSEPKNLRVVGEPAVRVVVDQILREADHLDVKVRIVNEGTGTSTSLSVTKVLINTLPTQSPMPMDLGELAPGGEAAFTAAFKLLPAGSTRTLRVFVTSNGITKRYDFSVQIP